MRSGIKLNIGTQINSIRIHRASATTSGAFAISPPRRVSSSFSYFSYKQQPYFMIVLPKNKQNEMYDSWDTLLPYPKRALITDRAAHTNGIGASAFRTI
jgi:hypothetical protein